MDENKEKAGFSIASFIPFKLKIGIVIGIFCFFFFMIVPVILITCVFSFAGNDDVETSSSLSSSGGDSGSSSSGGPITIVERNGLNFRTSSSYFCYPITNMTGTSGTFGQSGKMWSTGYHTGLDFIGKVGISQVVAVADGVVYSVSSSGSYGNHIIISHMILGTNGNMTPVFYTMYCHLNNINVSKGQKVVQGQVLGMMGSTGNVTGPHCHFEYSKNPSMFKSAQDPKYWIFEEHILKDNNVQVLRTDEQQSQGQNAPKTNTNIPTGIQ